MTIVILGICTSNLLTNNIQATKGPETTSAELTQAAKLVWKDDLNGLKEMVAHGMRVDVRLPGGYTLLHHAVSKKSTNCVAYLIKVHCPLNARTDITAFTALHFCALVGDTVDCKKLLDAGTLTDLRSNDGLTALQIASSKKHNEIVKLLKVHTKSRTTF